MDGGGWPATATARDSAQRLPHNRARERTGHQSRNSQRTVAPSLSGTNYLYTVFTLTLNIHTLKHGVVMCAHHLYIHIHTYICTHTYQGGVQVEEGNKWWPESWHLQGWVGQLHIPNIITTMGVSLPVLSTQETSLGQVLWCPPILWPKFLYPGHKYFTNM